MKIASFKESSKIVVKTVKKLSKVQKFVSEQADVGVSDKVFCLAYTSGQMSTVLETLDKLISQIEAYATTEDI